MSLLARVPASSPLPVISYFPAPFVRAETRQYQLAQHLGAIRQVFAVEDAPTLVTWAGGIVPRFTISRIDGDVTVLTRHTTSPFHGLGRRSARLARMLQTRSLAAFLAELGFVRTWVFTIGAFADWPLGDARLLRCADVNDPVFFGDPEAQWKLAAAVAAHSDLVTVTAGSLGDELRRRGVSSEPLPNAVSQDLIRRRPIPSGPPTVAYVGTLDWRFDFELVAAAARGVPECTFMIAGRVLPDFQESADALGALPNVELAGFLDEDAKVALLNRAHVGLVPFRRGAIADGVNPTKAYEYASYGLPIVSGPSQACAELGPAVRVGADADGIVAAVRAALADGPRSERSFELARNNTWAVRAQRLHFLMCDVERAHIREATTL